MSDSSSWRISQERIFGAPVMEPGGREEQRTSRPVCLVEVDEDVRGEGTEEVTVDVMVKTEEYSSIVMRFGTVTAPEPQTE